MDTPQTELTFIIGGDVMLGRLVKEAIVAYGLDHPLGPLAATMHQADITLINLECAITSNEQQWRGAPKAFYFGAPPDAITILNHCGVNLVNLANNHSLDYDYQGLNDTLTYLIANHITYAGAGHSQDEAFAPHYLIRKNKKVGMTAFCDHQADFLATENSPGIAYLNLDDEKEALHHFQKNLEIMRDNHVDWPILSLHWGPNMVMKPSDYFIHLAHQSIDMGYKMIFGHSAHIFHGIEIYQNCPIFYSTGDLVDDYYVDPEFKNDHQLLFEMRLVDMQLKWIKLYPVFIKNCQTSFAHGAQFDFIANRAKQFCHEFGTTVQVVDDKYLLIQP